MSDLELEWIKDPFNRYSVEWDHNMSRIIDLLETWCNDSGIKFYSFGHTQIAVCATFLHDRDAMLFKLRWFNV